VERLDEHPDGRVPHYPAGACECGADLAGARDLGVVASHQKIEIRLASAQVIQHDLHAMACGCGRVHQALPPPCARTAGAVTYGLSAQAWCVFLVAVHAIPVHRCAELVESLTGAKPSPGFVHQMIARAAAAVAAANKLIRALIILAHVICADETPIHHVTVSRPSRTGLNAYLQIAYVCDLANFFQHVNRKDCLDFGIPRSLTE
jgi:transposase